MSTIYISENAHKILLDYLQNSGHKLVLIKDTGLVYPEVATHADIYMCKLGAEPESPVFHAASIDQSGLGYKYPENVKYNGVCMGNYFIHNLKYTSPILMKEIKKSGLKTIHVNQGYTKCNMVVINNNSAVTSDEGIYNNINNYFDTSGHHSCQCLSVSYPDRINLLLVRPGHVKLDRFPYGFLGGASGRVGNEILFNGNLKAHPDFKNISEFIASQNLKLKYFEEYPLEDIGSIIEWRDK